MDFINPIKPKSKKYAKNTYCKPCKPNFISILTVIITKPLPNKIQTIVPSKVLSKVPSKLKSKFPDLSDAAWSVYTKIKENPHANAEELGMALKITGRMVRKHIATLREVGLIERIGSPKSGYWNVQK